MGYGARSLRVACTAWEEQPLGIELANPLPEPVTFAVTLEGPGLRGDAQSARTAGRLRLQRAGTGRVGPPRSMLALG